jgi:HEPN domain-containing protein
MSNTDEAVRWFRQAEHDIATARATTVAGSYDWACFQAQQGAEKALKALLYGKGYRKILTHSVYELLIEVGRAGYDLGYLHAGGKRLDQVYISARYPNGITGTLIPGEYYGKEDAEECLRSAGSILDAVRDYIRN